VTMPCYGIVDMIDRVIFSRSALVGMFSPWCLVADGADLTGLPCYWSKVCTQVFCAERIL